MAGSKLSPRQKMINVMYLVLTAILALNVSSEILQAFESLRNSMADSAESQSALNVSLASDILKTIETQEKNDNNKYAFVRPIIEKVNGETSDMIRYLDGISKELESIGEIDPITGEIVKKDEQEENYRFWLGNNDQANGGRGNGKAIELREKLIAFVDWANKTYEKHDPQHTPNRFAPLFLEPSEDPKVTKPESKSKTWEYFSFHNKPVVADMAMVKKFEMDIRDIQAGLLNLSKTLVQGFTFTVDSLIAFEAPRAQVVAAGMKYETMLGVGIASKSIKPEFVGNGLNLNEGGSTASMTITANGNVIPEGKTEGIQRYRAMIKVPKADGTIQDIPLEGQFIVRKPEVVVRSKALQILYKDCGNTVEVDVPALGDQYNPDFSRSTGGKVIKSSSNRKEITIVPNARQFKLSVHTNTNGQNVKLDRLTYNVVKPPKPRIAMFVGSQEHNMARPLNKRGSVIVKLIPDTEFAKTLPRDARYRAEKIKLMVQSGMGPPRNVASVSGAEIMRGVRINLNQGAIRSAYAGARIYIEVEGVKRVNFEGKKVGVGLSRAERFLSGILR